MTDTEQTPLCSRRSYLRAGATTGLSLGLAGCSTDSATPADDTTPEDGNSSDDGSSVELPAHPAVHFHSARTNDGESFTFTYDDLPEFRAPAQINEKNSGHPDTSNVDVAIEDGIVTLTLLDVAILRDVTVQLWGKTGNEWVNLGELDVQANNTDAEEPSNLQYQEETVEFTNVPGTDTHLASTYGLVLIDPSSVPDWDTHTPGRILKIVRTFAIPYDGPSGEREIRYFSGPTVNFESYRGALEPPTLRNDTLVEDLPNGDKLLFAIVDTPRGEYGVATVIPQNLAESQDYHRKNWPRLLQDASHAEDSPHFNTLAEEIRIAHEKLGNWNTTREKLRNYADFTAALKYHTRGNENRHPTGALLNSRETGGTNCTEKTLVFNALLQCPPFNYSSEDASYLYCTYNGGAHLVAGINVDQFPELQDGWETYEYHENLVEKAGAPDDVEFVPFDVTTGRVGRLSSDTFSDVFGFDNIDAEHGQA